MAQGYHVDGHHLVGVVDYTLAEQGAVGAHADDVLVVVVVRYGVHVVRHRQRLAFRRGARRRELAGLHAVVQPQGAHVQERRQDAVDAVVEQVVHLPLGGLRQPRDGDLHLVGLQRYVVAVEVAAVVHVLAVGVHDGVVAGRVVLVLYHLAAVHQRVVHRTQYLRRAAQRVVGLHLVLEVGLALLLLAVEVVFALGQAPAAGRQLAHAARGVLLSALAPHAVQLLGHPVVVARRHLVHPHRRQQAQLQQPLRVVLVHSRDARHHRCAVGDAQALADVYLQRLQTALVHDLLRRAPLAAVVHLALADERQRYVRQLHQVAARPHRAVLRYVGVDAAVYERRQQPYHAGVHAAARLQQVRRAGHHGRLHVDVLQRLAGTRRVAAYDVVLQVAQVAVVHAPLCHRAEARVDAVNHLLRREALEELVAALHLVHLVVADAHFRPAEERFLNICKGYLFHIVLLFSFLSVWCRILHRCKYNKIFTYK